MPDNSAIRILFVGDMHLGRLPSGIPEHPADPDLLLPANLGPAAAWRRTVDLAIKEHVHVVALAGDLVDRPNALFEAYGLLEAGIRRLTEQQIEVCAVAGNHDTETLPKLAGLIEKFHLLGPAGSWTEHLITGQSGVKVRLVGWSFPVPRHETSPLGQSQPAPMPGTTTLGLLHCDLNVSRSHYAPVSCSSLLDCGLDGWFLGHTHKPDPLPTDNQPFYLGSLTGMDAGEDGAHGPVLVTIDQSGAIVSRQRIPLAPLRWENLEIDCSELVDPATELGEWLLSALNRWADSFSNELTDVLALGVRLKLTGQVADPVALDLAHRRLNESPPITSVGGTTLFIQKISAAFTPRIDLLALAKNDDPPGLLAQQILLLENPHQVIPGIKNPEAEYAELLQQAASQLSAVNSRAEYSSLNDVDSAPDMEAIREKLITTGRLALAHLLRGQEATDAVN